MRCFVAAPAPSLELDGFIQFMEFCRLFDANFTPALARQIFISCNIEVRCTTPHSSVFLGGAVTCSIITLRITLLHAFPCLLNLLLPKVESVDSLDLKLINQMNPDLAMCRYEFIEGMFRAAMAKFPDHQPSTAVEEFV